MTSASQVNPAERILMGPGPSTVPHRVLRAMSAPTLGHLDPQYLAIMDESCEMLRQVFRTANKLTFPVSGTGMAGMEACLVNLLEPGDKAATILLEFSAESTLLPAAANRDGLSVDTRTMPGRRK